MLLIMSLQPTAQDGPAQAPHYAPDDGMRPATQVETLEHQLEALRESNRTLSRDVADQGKCSLPQVGNRPSTSSGPNTKHALAKYACI